MVRLCPSCLAEYPPGSAVCALDGVALVDDAQDPLIGETFHSYRLVEHAGTGGMARVYRAKHALLERWYAVKVLRGRLGATGRLLERFKREAIVVSQIEHPNVVGIVDFGSTREGRTFLVMEWIGGRALSAVLRAEAPLAPERAGELARQIASGLAAAHRLGVVHRDLKPGNTMVIADEIGRRELVKILDFGLAKIASEGIEGGLRLTEAGQLVGTPHYIAPEVFAGGEATQAADLYALGVVLYMMVSGDKPFRARTIPELVRAQVRERVAAVPGAQGLDRIAMRLLAVEPGARFASAGEVIQAIDALGLGTWSLRAPIVVPRAEVTGSYPVIDRAEEAIGEQEVSRVVVTGSYPRGERSLRELGAGGAGGEEVTTPGVELHDTLVRDPRAGDRDTSVRDTSVRDTSVRDTSGRDLGATAVTAPGVRNTLVRDLGATDMAAPGVRNTLVRDLGATDVTAPGVRDTLVRDLGATDMTAPGVRDTFVRDPRAQDTPRALSRASRWIAGGAALSTVIAAVVAISLQRSPRPPAPQTPQTAPAAAPSIEVAARPRALPEARALPRPAEQTLPASADRPPARARPTEPRREPERPEQDAPAAPDPAALERDIDRALADRGLSRSDLPELTPAVTEAAARFRAATTREAPAAARELIDQIRAAAIDAKLLKQKLARITAQLSASSNVIAADQLHALETRYFDLATAVQPNLQPGDYDKLARRIAALDRDVREARTR